MRIYASIKRNTHYIIEDAIYKKRNTLYIFIYRVQREKVTSKNIKGKDTKKGLKM